MDIFTKCYQHSFVDELRERDLFPYFRELQSRQDTEVIMVVEAPAFEVIE